MSFVWRRSDSSLDELSVLPDPDLVAMLRTYSPEQRVPRPPETPTGGGREEGRSDIDRER
jgi:hypothetical protein